MFDAVEAPEGMDVNRDLLIKEQEWNDQDREKSEWGRRTDINSYRIGMLSHVVIIDTVCSILESAGWHSDRKPDHLLAVDIGDSERAQVIGLWGLLTENEPDFRIFGEESLESVARHIRDLAEESTNDVPDYFDFDVWWFSYVGVGREAEDEDFARDYLANEGFNLTHMPGDELDHIIYMARVLKENREKALRLQREVLKNIDEITSAFVAALKSGTWEDAELYTPDDFTDYLVKPDDIDAFWEFLRQFAADNPRSSSIRFVSIPGVGERMQANLSWLAGNIESAGNHDAFEAKMILHSAINGWPQSPTKS